MSKKKIIILAKFDDATAKVQTKQDIDWFLKVKLSPILFDTNLIIVSDSDGAGIGHYFLSPHSPLEYSPLEYKDWKLRRLCNFWVDRNKYLNSQEWCINVTGIVLPVHWQSHKDIALNDYGI